MLLPQTFTFLSILPLKLLIQMMPKFSDIISIQNSMDGDMMCRPNILTVG